MFISFSVCLSFSVSLSLYIYIYIWTDGWLDGHLDGQMVGWTIQPFLEMLSASKKGSFISQLLVFVTFLMDFSSVASHRDKSLIDFYVQNIYIHRGGHVTDVI